MYFNPGTCIMHGKVCFSTWVIAYHESNQYRYERTNLDAAWIRVS